MMQCTVCNAQIEPTTEAATQIYRRNGVLVTVTGIPATAILQINIHRAVNILMSCDNQNRQDGRGKRPQGPRGGSTVYADNNFRPPHLMPVRLPKLFLKFHKTAGCTDIFLFGSLAHGQIHPGTAIDLAVRGCPSGQFFQLWGKLSSELDYAMNLVSLDLQQDFGRFLQEEQGLMKIEN